MKISTKLAVFFSTTIILVGLVPSYLYYTASITELEKSISGKLEGMASDTMHTMDERLNERYLDIKLLATDPVISAKNASAKQITERLMSYKNSHPSYASLSFYDLNRIRIADTAGLQIGVRHAVSEYWPEILAGKNFVSNLSHSESLGEPVFHFAAVVNNEEGRPVGVVVSRLHLASFGDILKDHLAEYKLESETSVELLDKNGLIIYSSRNKADMFKNTSPIWGAINVLLGRGVNLGEFNEQRDLFVFAREQGYLNFKGNDWVLVLSMPKQLAFASVIKLRDTSRWLVLMVAALLFPVIFFFSGAIVRPICNLRDAALEIGRGNLKAKVGSNSDDEFGELAATFNRMTDALQSANDAREKAEGLSRASAEQYRSLVNHIPDVVWTTDQDGNTIFISPNITRTLGYAVEEIYANPSLWLGNIHPDDRPGVEAAFGDLFTKQQKFSIEYRIKKKDGEWIWLYDRAFATYEKDGKCYADGIFTDITERKEIEGKLLNSRASLRTIMDNAPYMIWLKDTAGRYLTVNMEFLRASGRSQMHEVIGKTDFDLWSQVRAEKLRADDAEVMSTRQQKLAEECEPNDQGEMRWLETLKIAVVDTDGNLLGTSGFARDITERRRMEHKLKRDAERVEALLEINSVGGSLPEKDCLRFGLEMAERLTGSKVAFIHFVNEDQENIELVTWSSATTETYCEACYDSHYPVARAGIWADCLRQKQAVIFNNYAEYAGKHGLPEGHAELQRLMSVPVIEEGLVRIIIGVGNKESDYGAGDVQIAQLIGHDLWRIIQRQRSDAELKQNLEQQRVLNKKLEEAHSHLLQSEKMASLGQLAAGVAHELNNPIGFVYSNMGTLQNYLNDIFVINTAYEAAENTPAKEALERVHKLKQDKDYDFIKQDIFQLMEQSKDGLTRMRKIVQDLKDFSHVGEEGWKWVDLHKGIDSTLNIVWNELKYKCQVNKEYGVLPEVHCMASQINQVFLNLLVNAGQAIESKGTITIRTGVEGSEVWVEIADTGKGISPEDIKRIFEPFFTTKPIGVGTGLGLSLSYGIMQKHHGRIEVKSEVGKGTAMRICLPVNSQPTL